ncbi:UbiA prenyltransferase family [Collybia nuda]|uniref:UbiA prenyltransferase family n=1 Tax=Collybia nuda TaxID=64659 RepID=A0A9P5YGT6_9AGAR|nr:UbiA prenyltransferase family [Collybia nuda]
MHFSIVGLAKPAFQKVWYAIVTLFLFTKSDIKTVIIPVGIFAIASAPLYSLNKIPGMFFWIWLHLLQFDTSNQTMDIEEDRHNKPDRPIPSNRLTIKNAIILRWALILTCLLFSASYNNEVACASVVIAAFTVIYNELGGHASHWAMRNILNAIILASFEWGSTLLAGADSRQLTDTGILAVCISFGIFATTIQVQDFQDVQGDQKINRQTLPILFPAGSRYTPLVTILTWSVGLSFVWHLPTAVAAVFVALALFVGMRFLFRRTRYDDQISYYWYNVWVSAAHILPGIWLLANEEIH